VIVRFTGTVTQAADPGGLSDGSIVVGTSVSGELRYDDAMETEFLFPPHEVDWFNFPGSISLQAGNYALRSDDPGITLEDFAPAGTGTDLFNPVSRVVPAVNAHGSDTEMQFGFLLQDSTRLALSSLELAAVRYDLERWDAQSFIAFELYSPTAGEFLPLIRFDSLTRVPEPPMGAPSAVAILVVALRRREWRHHLSSQRNSS
jgi:hypothetical protein